MTCRKWHDSAVKQPFARRTNVRAVDRGRRILRGKLQPTGSKVNSRKLWPSAQGVREDGLRSGGAPPEYTYNGKLKIRTSATMMGGKVYRSEWIVCVGG